MSRLAAAAIALAVVAAGCATGGGDVPDWVVANGERVAEPYREAAEIARTEYVEGETEWRVVHALDRIVPCPACTGPSIAEPPRGDMVEHRWDKETRRHTFFGFCVWNREHDEPLNGCSTRP